MKRNIEFEEILKMTQKGLKKNLSKRLNKSGYKTHEEDGFLFAKGDYPVLLVAHMDTVHAQSVKKIKYFGDIMWSPQGIGGDDRCGVYIILQLIKELRCSVVFLEDEEIGCVGAEKFAKSKYVHQLDDINYIVEFDRRGSTDAVFYECDNPDFEEFILSTEYFKTEIGIFSDIGVIAPALGKAAVNLSSGYHDEHSVKETINLSEVNMTIEEARKILKQPVEQPFEYIERVYSGWENYFYNNKYYYLASEDQRAFKYYHIYLYNEYGTELCIEVKAINEDEAIGIFLSDNRFIGYSYCDIIDIVEEKY